MRSHCHDLRNPTKNDYRKAKVKCFHEGHPPCRRCQRGNRHGCVLTDPRASSLRPRGDSSRVQHKAISASKAVVDNVTINPVDSSDIPHLTGSNPVASLSPSTLISACDTYRKKFPVANFLHYPSLIANISANPSYVDSVFVASLLSLCARFLPEYDLDPGETYAEYARSELARKAFETPSLSLAQSLVMLVFYEWGSGRPYKAWMYSGEYIPSFYSIYH